jgi:hypothetical protein
VGGLTGVAAGVLLDVVRRGSEMAGSAGKRAVDLAPKAADRIKAAASTGATKLHDAEIGDHAKDLAHRLADSDVADQARDKLERAAKKGAELAQSVSNTASNVTDRH